MRASLGFGICAALALAACDVPNVTRTSGGDTHGGSLNSACAALVAAQTGVPTQSVLLSNTSAVNGGTYRMTARVPGTSALWACDVQGGDRIVGVYPASQAPRSIGVTNGQAPVYRVSDGQITASTGQTFRVAPNNAQSVTTQPRTYVVQSPGYQSSARQVQTAPQTYQVSNRGVTNQTYVATSGQTEYRTLSPQQGQTYRVATQPQTHQVQTQPRTYQVQTTNTRRTFCNPLIQRCSGTASGAAVLNQPTYAGGAEPTYHQNLYSDQPTGATRVGSRTEYVVPSQQGVNF